MRVLYLSPTGELRIVDDPRLDATTERHKMALAPVPYPTDRALLQVLDADPSLGGVVIEMYTGWVGREYLAIAAKVRSRDRRVWLYWPAEEAIECVNGERLASLRRHWVFVQLGRNVGLRWLRVVREWDRLLYVVRNTARWDLMHIVARRMARTIGVLPPKPAPASGGTAPDTPDSRDQTRLHTIQRARTDARPVPLPAGALPTCQRRVPGCGVYLRTDFWSRIESGGSYGHTCYVVKELAATTESFVCFMTQRFRLLDDFGIRQVVLDAPSATSNEDDIVSATDHYVRLLKPACEALAPAYIYERLCLGNYAGALLSRALNVPYIVEYNGSEISMHRSFDGARYVYEEEYLAAEALAFEQATMISVVSSAIRNALIQRGVDPAKILVNPNGVDLASYAPLDSAAKRDLRASLGFDDDECVIGFTGTFGGWHGIDVLSEALPRICARAPHARFLLVGDGNYKHLVDDAIAVHSLEPRVRRTGRVPQAEGARLLKACDMYVSPHSSHMVDSRFFGSPTKIFEYMALGGGIVASDLEQIGDVLSPAFAPSDFIGGMVAVTDERSVLCPPGDVDQFVDAVVALANRPDLRRALGANARKAAAAHYSWTQHVASLWQFLSGEIQTEWAVHDLRKKRRLARELVPVGAYAGVAAGEATVTAVKTGDAYKDEVQRQWDNDPAGSHYVEKAHPHTKEWFLEAEAYRYSEYAPWMPQTMEFATHAAEEVLEIGGGMGTDLAAFAAHGARVTNVDLSAGHLALARENFAHRNLSGRFVHHDAETLPFGDESFDLVYSNGVIHHTPNTAYVVDEIFRVLRPGGRTIVMVYSENSLHYWRNLVWEIGIKEDQLQYLSMGEIMSRHVEKSERGAARPLVKVYTRERLRRLFRRFEDIRIVRRQLISSEVPPMLSRVPARWLGPVMGWNLIIKAQKPARG